MDGKTACELAYDKTQLLYGYGEEHEIAKQLFAMLGELAPPQGRRMVRGVLRSLACRCSAGGADDNGVDAETTAA